MSRSGAYLDATLGCLQRTAASLAIGSVEDIRAQRWLARRLPDACGYLEKRTFAPWPTRNPLDPFGDGWRPDHTRHLGHPVYTEALVRSETSDRKALAAHRRGEVVVYFFSNQFPPTFDVVIDWLNGLPKHDPPFLNRLSSVTWPQAEVRAKRWHQCQPHEHERDERAAR